MEYTDNHEQCDQRISRLRAAIEVGTKEEVEQTLRETRIDTKQVLDFHYHTNSLHIALFARANNHRSRIVELLLLHGADVNLADGLVRTPLHIAVTYGDLDIINMLLDAGANIDTKNNLCRTSIEMAAELKKTDVVKLLERKGACVSLEFYSQRPEPVQTILRNAVGERAEFMTQCLNDVFFRRLDPVVQCVASYIRLG